jgi:hypothetical protein
MHGFPFNQFVGAVVGRWSPSNASYRVNAGIPAENRRTPANAVHFWQRPLLKIDVAE